MGTTNAQRKKHQKKKARERKLRKDANVRRCLAQVQWRLDVMYEGSWRHDVKRFRRWSAVEAHAKETEELREKGVEVVAGRIINLVSGDTDMEIAPSPARIDGKGALPDKFAGDPESAKKGLVGVFEE